MVSNILLGLIGVAILGLTIIVWGASIYKSLFWKPAVGRILGFKKREGCFCPRVEFVSMNGDTIVFVSDAGCGVKGAQVGDQIRVLYHPTDPSKAAVREFRYMWTPCLMLGAIAIVFILIAIKEWLY